MSQPLPPTVEPRPARWTVVVGLLSAALFSWMLTERNKHAHTESDAVRTLAKALFVAPFVAAMPGAFLRWRRLSLLGVGLSAAWLWLLVGVELLVLSYYLFSPYFVVGLAGLILVIPNAVLAALATRSAVRVAGPWSGGGAVVGLSYFSLLMAIFIPVTGRMHGPGLAAHREISNQMLSVTRCNYQFAGRHAGAFAESLADLGPRGSGCLQDAWTRNVVAGFEVSYFPVRAPGGGPVTGYELSATWRSFMARDSYSLFTDQEGLIQFEINGPSAYTPGGRMVTTWAPNLMLRLSECLKEPNQREGGAEAALLGCLRSDGIEEEVSRYARMDMDTEKYNLRYEPLRTANGDLTEFRLWARPRTYGVESVRSYFMSVERLPSWTTAGRFAVHATAADRDATASDPLAMACEARIGSCASPLKIGD